MATVYDQPKSTYSDAGPDIRVISDIVNIIDPVDTPFIAAIGGLDGASSKLRITQKGTKIEWLEDEYSPLSGTANHTTTIATNDTTWTVTDASIFRDGMIVQIDNELMIVKSADPTGNTVAVYSRSYGGTNATHASTSTMNIVGMARLEGDDADFSGLNALTIPYNYTSIFQDAFKLTGTAAVIPQYGIPDAKEYHSAKKIPDLLRQVERGCFWSIRAVGTASAPRSMGGLGTYITDNTTTAGSSKVTKTLVDDLAESIYSDGGNPDLFVCTPGTARDLRDIYDNSSFVRLDNMNTQFGMMPVVAIRTQWGELKIIQSRHCRADHAYMLTSKKVGLYSLRPFHWSDLAKNGDSERIEVVGELSLAVANDKSHGKIIGIST